MHKKLGLQYRLKWVNCNNTRNRWVNALDCQCPDLVREFENSCRNKGELLSSMTDTTMTDAVAEKFYYGDRAATTGLAADPTLVRSQPRELGSPVDLGSLQRVSVGPGKAPWVSRQNGTVGSTSPWVAPATRGDLGRASRHEDFERSRLGYTLGSPSLYSVLHSLCSLDINSTLLLTLT